MSDLLSLPPGALLAFLAVGVGALYAFSTLRGFFRVMWKEANILKHGVPAEATVLQMKDTGWRINKRPLFETLLEVRQPDRPPYQVKVMKRLVSMQGAWMLDVGMRLDVKVDPKDPQSVAIVGAAVPPAAFQSVSAGLPSAGDPVKAMSDLQKLRDAGLITQNEYDEKRAQILARL